MDKPSLVPGGNRQIHTLLENRVCTIGHNRLQGDVMATIWPKIQAHWFAEWGQRVYDDDLRLAAREQISTAAVSLRRRHGTLWLRRRAAGPCCRYLQRQSDIDLTSCVIRSTHCNTLRQTFYFSSPVNGEDLSLVRTWITTGARWPLIYYRLPQSFCNLCT